MAIETYPPRRYFFIKEQEPEVPNDYIEYMNEVYGEFGSKVSMEMAIEFLGEPPMEADLPDFLKEDKMKTDWGELFDEYGKKFIAVYDLLACSAGILSSQELHLYILIRRQVRPENVHDYFKIPVIPQGQSEYARQMGVSLLWCKHLFKSLEKKGFIRIEREPGKKNKIWLNDLREIMPLETRKLPPPERCIRSLMPKRGKE